MANFIAEAFKALFAILAFCSLLIVALVSSAATANSGPFVGALVGLAGLVLVIMFFGVVALQIQSNQLLRRIADAAPPADGRHQATSPAYTPSETGAWPSRREPPMLKRASPDTRRN